MYTVYHLSSSSMHDVFRYAYKKRKARFRRLLESGYIYVKRWRSYTDFLWPYMLSKQVGRANATLIASLHGTQSLK
jgi:hypothetical protein